VKRVNSLNLFQLSYATSVEGKFGRSR